MTTKGLFRTLGYLGLGCSLLVLGYLAGIENSSTDEPTVISVVEDDSVDRIISRIHPKDIRTIPVGGDNNCYSSMEYVFQDEIVIAFIILQNVEEETVFRTSYRPKSFNVSFGESTVLSETYWVENNNSSQWFDLPEETIPYNRLTLWMDSFYKSNDFNGEVVVVGECGIQEIEFFGYQK